MRDWQILKLLFTNRSSPDEGKQGPANKNSYKTRIKSRTKQPARHHPKLEIQGQHHRHTPTTPTQGTASTTRHATNPQTKVHWHTIEFSNNTRTITHHQKLGSCKKRLCRHYTHHNHKVKTLQTVKHIFLCRPAIVFLTAISPATLLGVCPAGRCRSR